MRGGSVGEACGERHVRRHTSDPHANRGSRGATRIHDRCRTGRDSGRLVRDAESERCKPMRDAVCHIRATREYCPP
eukprot:2247049-Prymnesium_polylepis.1